MADDVIITRCVIDELKNGPNGPGFYYTLSDAEETSEPIGPYADAAKAEEAFIEAASLAAEAMVKQQLGLED